jgi:ribosomal protein S6
MRFYELVLIVRHDSDPEKVLSNLFGDIWHAPSNDCSILKKEPWGLRKFAYLIDGEKRGNYFLLGLRASGQYVRNMSKKLSSSSDLLRSVFIKVDSLDEGKSAILLESAKA